MRRKIGKFLLFVSVSSLLAFAGFIAYDLWDNNRAGDIAEQRAQAVAEWIKSIRELAETPAEAQETLAEPPGDVPPESDLFEIDGNLYLGLLSIPALSLELPINYEWNTETHKDTPGRYAGGLYHSLVVAGHNYRRHLGRISRLSRGDTAVITGVNGVEHVYVVELVTQISGTELDAIVRNPYDLTLFTCTLSRTERTVVRCTKISPARGETDGGAFFTITAEQAHEMLTNDTAIILLDVRTEAEYREAHIGGALLIPHNELTERAEGALSDKNAVILVYCESGGRSAGAAQTLADMGYTRVYDFGGIRDWPYETAGD